jgi:hypothetical protein
VVGQQRCLVAGAQVVRGLLPQAGEDLHRLLAPAQPLELARQDLLSQLLLAVQTHAPRRIRCSAQVIEGRSGITHGLGQQTLVVGHVVPSFSRQVRIVRERAQEVAGGLEATLLDEQQGQHGGIVDLAEQVLCLATRRHRAAERLLGLAGTPEVEGDATQQTVNSGSVGAPRVSGQPVVEQLRSTLAVLPGQAALASLLDHGGRLPRLLDLQLPRRPRPGRGADLQAGAAGQHLHLDKRAARQCLDRRGLLDGRTHDAELLASSALDPQPQPPITLEPADRPLEHLGAARVLDPEGRGARSARRQCEDRRDQCRSPARASGAPAGLSAPAGHAQEARSRR